VPIGITKALLAPENLMVAFVFSIDGLLSVNPDIFRIVASSPAPPLSRLTEAVTLPEAFFVPTPERIRLLYVGVPLTD
jgi:hypothetical protein